LYAKAGYRNKSNISPANISITCWYSQVQEAKKTKVILRTPN